MVTDEPLAGPLELLNSMVAVSGVGALAVKVTPSTVNDEVLPTVEELRVPTTPVSVAATGLPVRDWLQSFFTGLFPLFAIAAARLCCLCTFWKRGSLTMLFHFWTVPFLMASESVPGLEKSRWWKLQSSTTPKGLALVWAAEGAASKMERAAILR